MEPADINVANQSKVHLLSRDIIRTFLFLAAVGALECVRHAILEDSSKSVQKSEFVVFCKTQQ